MASQQQDLPPDIRFPLWLPAPLRLLKGQDECKDSAFVIALYADPESAGSSQDRHLAAARPAADPPASSNGMNVITAGVEPAHLAPAPASPLSGPDDAPDQQGIAAPGAADSDDDDRDDLTGGSALALSQPTMSDFLFIAVSSNNTNHVDELLASGLDVNTRSSGGMHVLFRAVHRARTANIVRRLLDNAADIHAVDPLGQSVIHYWAMTRKSPPQSVQQTADLLLERRADLNHQRNDGKTPLHVVAEISQDCPRNAWLPFHKARWLVAHGARANVPCNEGRLPFELVMSDHRPGNHQPSKEALREFLAHVPVAGTPVESWPTCNRPECSWCRPGGVP